MNVMNAISELHKIPTGYLFTGDYSKGALLS